MTVESNRGTTNGSYSELKAELEHRDLSLGVDRRLFQVSPTPSAAGKMAAAGGEGQDDTNALSYVDAPHRVFRDVRFVNILKSRRTGFGNLSAEVGGQTNH